MAGEWVPVVGTVAGGLVGVVGTLGATLLNDRREQRAAERDRGFAIADARREERKRTYVRFLDEVNSVEAACRELAVAARRNQVTIDAMNLDSIQDLKRTLIELDLIGSRAVAYQAGVVFGAATALHRAAIEPPYEWGLVAAETIGELVRVMGEDLADAAEGSSTR